MRDEAGLIQVSECFILTMGIKNAITEHKVPAMKIVFFISKK